MATSGAEKWSKQKRLRLDIGTKSNSISKYRNVKMPTLVSIANLHLHGNLPISIILRLTGHMTRFVALIPGCSKLFCICKLVWQCQANHWLHSSMKLSPELPRFLLPFSEAAVIFSLLIALPGCKQEVQQITTPLAIWTLICNRNPKLFHWP